MIVRETPEGTVLLICEKFYYPVHYSHCPPGYREAVEAGSHRAYYPGDENKIILLSINQEVDEVKHLSLVYKEQKEMDRKSLELIKSGRETSKIRG